MDKLPEPHRCGRCGKIHSWFVWVDPPAVAEGPMAQWERELGFDRIDMRKEVDEQPCPHGNGTMIERCTNCSEPVGMWGAGMVGSMECECWESAW